METRILTIHYIGWTKERGKGRAAFGLLDDGTWNIIFPENVLKEWFGTPIKPDEQSTLYSVLGLKDGATADEIKSAFRRLSKQWHPDVCKENGAHEVYLRINESYQILSNQMKRARYDAGLALEATIKPDYKAVDTGKGYRSPLRCGLIVADGHVDGNRFVVEVIKAWEDIINQNGQCLVSSWVYGNDKPTLKWV